MPSSDRITRESGRTVVQVLSQRYVGPDRDHWCDVRRVERLQNGRWRVDLPGGLVEMFESEPRTRRVER